MNIRSIFDNINTSFQNKNRLTHFFILTAAGVIVEFFLTFLHKAFYDKANWIALILTINLYLILLSLSWLMTKGSKLILTVSFIVIIITFLTIFGFILEYIVVSLVAFGLLTFGSLKAMKETDERTNIRCFAVFRTGLPFTLTGFILLITIAFYLWLPTHQIPELKVPRPIFDFIVQYLQVEKITDKDQNLPPDQTNSKFEISPQLLEQLGISPDEAVSQEDLMYQIVNLQLNRMVKPFEGYYKLGAALGVFFTLKAVSVIFMYLVIFITWVLFRLLVVMGAVKINVEPTIKEVIEI